MGDNVHNHLAFAVALTASLAEDLIARMPSAPEVEFESKLEWVKQ